MATPTAIDHTERALERLPSQWQETEKVKGWLESYTDEVNDVEELLFQLLTERGISTAVGAQLDILGALFDLSRDGRTDTQYRNAILGQASVAGQDGTTEVFMQAMRSHTGSNFVDFWEHLSGDVHALLGDGFYYNSWLELKDKVPAGVNLRIYADDQFDSFQGAEILTNIADLQTNGGEDIQVSPDGVELFDLQVQYGEISDSTAQLSILPEIVDQTEEPFLAELLFAAVAAVSGDIVDNFDENIVDESGNALIWVDYEF